MVFKKTDILLYNYIAISILNVVLNYSLIPKYGIEGAALATGISYLFWSALLLYESRRYAGVLPFTHRVTRVLLSAVAVTALFWLLKPLFPIGGRFALLSALALFTVAFMFCLLLSKSFEQEDRVVISSIEQKLGIKIEWLNNLLNKFIKEERK